MARSPRNPEELQSGPCITSQGAGVSQSAGEPWGNSVGKQRSPGCPGKKQLPIPTPLAALWWTPSTTKGPVSASQPGDHQGTCRCIRSWVWHWTGDPGLFQVKPARAWRPLHRTSGLIIQEVGRAGAQGHMCMSSLPSCVPDSGAQCYSMLTLFTQRAPLCRLSWA